MASTGTGSLTALSAVAWKKTGGTTLTRRGLFLGAEQSMPHISLEPLTANVPASTQLVEGEIVYDGIRHMLCFMDGTRVQDCVPTLAYYTAAQSAITSTTGVALPTPLQARMDGVLNAVWEIEWNVSLTFSVTTATLVAKVSPSSGTFNGYWTIEGTNGAPDGAAVAKRASTNDLTVTIGATTAIGNPGSTTKPVIVRVRAVVQMTAGILPAVTLLVGSSSGTVTPQALSTMKATRIA